MLTDRFIKIPVYIYDAAEEELTGKDGYHCEKMVVETRVNPFEITYYRATVENDAEYSEENLIWTTINLKNGEQLTALMTIQEFEELLNKHQQ
jgi:hypothetical protein